MDETLNYLTKQDLYTPGSPYYLGAPSTYETINRYLNGRGPYNTNYLGNINNRFLTPSRADHFELQNRLVTRRRNEGIFDGIIAGATILGSVLLLRKTPQLLKKIPLINKLFKK